MISFYKLFFYSIWLFLPLLYHAVILLEPELLMRVETSIVILGVSRIEQPIINDSPAGIGNVPIPEPGFEAAGETACLFYFPFFDVFFLLMILVVSI